MINASNKRRTCKTQSLGPQQHTQTPETETLLAAQHWLTSPLYTSPSRYRARFAQRESKMTILYAAGERQIRSTIEARGTGRMASVPFAVVQATAPLIIMHKEHVLQTKFTQKNVCPYNSSINNFFF